MSQFSDIVADVYTITNRPELVAETTLFVRQATLDAHRSDKYPRDRKEVSLVVSPAASLIQVSISGSLPNFRQFDYIRPFDSVTGVPAALILGQNEFIAPDAIFDEFIIEKTNVAYVGGDNLNLRFEASWGGLIVSYWTNPIISPDASYASWVATDYPAVITIDAARRVLASIGWEEAAQNLKRILLGDDPRSTFSMPTGGEYATFKQSALESIGR